MTNLTDNNTESTEEVLPQEESTIQEQADPNKVLFEIEQGGKEKSFEQNLLLSMLDSYEQAFNRANKKNVIKFRVSTSTHKIPTEQGNKDVGILTVERLIRPIEGEEDWASMLIHKELFYFSHIKQRLTPAWKDQLYLNTVARLVGAGLEYAELLKRMKMIKDAEKKSQQANEAPIQVTGQMPTPLNQQEVEYKEWLAKERAAEGLS